MEEGEGVNYESFRESWLQGVRLGSPSTVDLGRRFSLKLATQVLDADESSADIVYCDGAGDGGIDVAILDTGPDELSSAPEQSGHKWYLVQSKYGSAFKSTATLLTEGQKVIDTLDGKRSNLSSLAAGLLERLTNFKNSSGPADSIVLVFATVDPLNVDEKRVLNDLCVLGRGRLGSLFDVETISVETVFRRLRDQESTPEDNRVRVNIEAKLVRSSDELLIGATPLLSMYKFLGDYRSVTGDLDQIYEKNLRRFLGGRGRVNKAMEATLRDAPERFGLYNNGVTIVAADYSTNGDTIELTEPYIVNGCQTSRTIWEVFRSRLASGGTGVNPEIEDWKNQAGEGVVVLKVVRIGSAGDSLLPAITRYTNSQNAVREKDFLALTADFHTWKDEVARQFDLYLEIQRGGWDSQRALQSSNPATRQFEKSANAADLMKVYGAGWLGEPGLAFGKNPPFLPGGSVFNRIMGPVPEGDEPFAAPDLYAAYLLQQAATDAGFGRNAALQSRSQTRFLFYFVTVELLRDALSRGSLPTTNRAISAAILELRKTPEGFTALIDQALELIDAYLNQTSDNCVFKENAFTGALNYDLNAFLKSTQLGKPESTPMLRDELGIQKGAMGRQFGGHPSRRQIILEVLKGKPLV